MVEQLQVDHPSGEDQDQQRHEPGREDQSTVENPYFLFMLIQTEFVCHSVLMSALVRAITPRKT